MKLICIASMLPAVLLTLLFSGCGQGRPRYFIYMVNRTSKDYDAVAVYYGTTMAAQAGAMVPGGLASFGYVTLPIPPEAEVCWVDGTTPHAAKVKLRGVVPDVPIEMNLYFIIEGDGSVTVRSVRNDDLAGRAAATRGIERFQVRR